MHDTEVPILDLESIFLIKRALEVISSFVKLGENNFPAIDDGKTVITV